MTSVYNKTYILAPEMENGVLAKFDDNGQFWLTSFLSPWSYKFDSATFPQFGLT